MLPTYNDVCVSTVRKLSTAMESLPFDHEVIVADDASSDLRVKEANRSITHLPACTYIERKDNTGRAAIRNFLARQAHYAWLLFIDADMEIADASNFILSYMESKGDIVYGGYHIAPGKDVLPGNLRLRYELSREGTSTHQTFSSGATSCSPTLLTNVSVSMVLRMSLMANHFYWQATPSTTRTYPPNSQDSRAIVNSLKRLRLHCKLFMLSKTT